MDITLVLGLVIVAALGGLAYAAFNFFSVKKLEEGTERMQEIASAIRVGANAFITYEYKIVAIVAVLVVQSKQWEQDISISGGEWVANGYKNGAANGGSMLDVVEKGNPYYNYKITNETNHSMNNVSYKLDPSTISIKISEKESEVYNIAYDLVNENKLDKKLSIKSIKLDKNEVIVKGSRETLNTIANVKALIDVEAANLTNKGEYNVDSIKLVAYDSNGNKIDAEIVPSKIDATVIITSPQKEVPLKIIPKN